jgi:hypothetical protein
MHGHTGRVQIQIYIPQLMQKREKDRPPVHVGTAQLWSLIKAGGLYFLITAR